MKMFLYAALLASSFQVFANDHSSADLAFAKGAVVAQATWLQGPQKPDESVLQIDWKNGSDLSPMKPPGTFKVSLWMPEHGHGSSPPQITQMTDSKGEPIVGSFQVSKIYFTMAGDWETQVTLTYQDGTEETKSVMVNLPE